jgi:DNA-binding IclR family transcriptional regulator
MLLTMKRTPPIQSVERALILLGEVGKADRPLSLRELTGVLGIDRSSVFRLAGTLQRRGYLVQLPDTKHYTVGPAIRRLAEKAKWADVLARVAGTCAANLAEATGEIAHLAVREAQNAVIIFHRTPKSLASSSIPMGCVVPLHCTAIGKALLLGFNADNLNSIFGRNKLAVLTQRTIGSIEQLATACATTRAQGYAIDDEEFHNGIRCLAAPVRDRGGVVAAVGVSAPIVRFPRSAIESVAKSVKLAAEELSDTLGLQQTNSLENSSAV